MQRDKIDKDVAVYGNEVIFIIQTYKYCLYYDEI
jgi:hypothetical protein